MTNKCQNGYKVLSFKTIF